jgi:hypothetical protein
VAGLAQGCQTIIDEECIMEWKISYNEEDKIIKVEAEGVFDSMSEENLRNEVLEWMDKYDCLKLLLDFKRISELKIGIFEIYNIPQKYITQKIPRKLKIAILFDGGYIEKFKFYETVSLNVGYQVSLFTELDPAIKWLKE